MWLPFAQACLVALEERKTRDSVDTKEFLRGSPTLILDGATSALDKKSRERVMVEIIKWRKGETTIIITHNVSQIQDHDLRVQYLFKV
jgi:ABC-type transport system involved in cytochrome bd biosynthesis fused ATPase/permease subunit